MGTSEFLGDPILNSNTTKTSKEQREWPSPFIPGNMTRRSKGTLSEGGTNPTLARETGGNQIPGALPVRFGEF